jgi:class 3 adenylate cyclase
VNLAARLCEHSTVNRLALTSYTLSESGVADQVAVEPMGAVRMKGYDDMFKAFVVKDLGPKAKERLRICMQMISDTPQVMA